MPAAFCFVCTCRSMPCCLSARLSWIHEAAGHPAHAGGGKGHDDQRAKLDDERGAALRRQRGGCRRIFGRRRQ